MVSFILGNFHVFWTVVFKLFELDWCRLSSLICGKLAQINKDGDFFFDHGLQIHACMTLLYGCSILYTYD